MKYITVFITVPDEKTSQKIIKKLLCEKLVSCVSVVSDLKSVYRWKGKICSSKEKLLICKSIKNNFKEIVKSVKSVHPYEVPEIVSLDISAGSTEYLEWISNTTLRR